MPPKAPLKEMENETHVEENATCEIGGCPPSHRLARRVSLTIIAILIFLILAAGIWLMIGGNA